jgi:hypothetical protein
VEGVGEGGDAALAEGVVGEGGEAGGGAVVVAVDVAVVGWQWRWVAVAGWQEKKWRRLYEY